ncbi:MAG: methanol/ethanol family PQQ-dependent dehydrogenase [Vulcanimicrobiaceae bacterium]
MTRSRPRLFTAAFMALFLMPLGRVSAQSTVAAAGTQPASTVPYKSVTSDQLIHPSDSDWLLPRRTYSGTAFSPLSQINMSNIKELKPVWSFSTGVTEGHEAPPIVNNGVMFVATPQAQVIALDARTGDQIWRFKHPLPDDLLQLHPTSRGVGLLGDMVYVGTVDAHLLALDAHTGKVVWDKKVADYKKGYYITMAPLVVKDKVMVGTSGGEMGVRGFLAAYDAKTGTQAWRFHTVPAPGEKGGDSWQGDTYKNGGAPVWVTGTYDPQLDLMYWGVGNPGPWLPDERGTANGAALFSDSVLAIKPENGEVVAYHQYNPNDAWDWDEVDPPMIVDIERGGKTVHSLVHPGRDGYIWDFERSANAIKFVSATPFVKNEVITKIDPVTGKPSYNKAMTPTMDGKPTTYCPSAWGGKNWFGAAIDSKDGMLFTPANDNLCSIARGIKPTYKAGEPYVGEGIDDLELTLHPGADHVGELQAWNLSTGKQVWKHNFKDSQNWGPVLATAGGLIFEGGTNDRMFRAFDAKTGNVVWSMRGSSGFMGAPIAFALDGKEYIAVQSGWGIDGERTQTSFNRHLPEQYHAHVPQGGTVWVFAVQ